MVKIAPSILSADFMNLGKSITDALDAGADLIHIDVMDGHFVPNITIGQGIVSAINRLTSAPLDVHLMITEPDRYLEDFVNAGADYITVHVEACVHLHRTLQKIRQLGAKPAVSLNPATSLDTIKYILGDIDMVLIMSVNPGFGGQSYIPFCTQKVETLKQMIDKQGLEVLIEVDGGITTENAHEVISAGADIVVMGSAFFGAKDYKEVVNKVKGISA